MIGGVGELDLVRNGTAPTVRTTPEPSPRWAERPYPDCPYLLLDVRDRDQYDQCHIISGRAESQSEGLTPMHFSGRGPCLKGCGGGGVVYHRVWSWRGSVH